jgi:hypothetical protein
MNRYATALVVAVSLYFPLFTAPAGAQGSKIEIPAGTPEDHDLQAISNE